MPNRIQELEDFIPSYLHRKPRKASLLEGIEWGILVIIVAIALVAGLRALHVEAGRVIDGMLNEAHASELPKSEADWEREICANLDRYQNGEEFADYCAGL